MSECICASGKHHTNIFLTQSHQAYFVGVFFFNAHMFVDNIKGKNANERQELTAEANEANCGTNLEILQIKTENPEGSKAESRAES